MSFSAVIMGLVEGLTEFLPVSSTGHLILMEEVLNFKGPEGRVFEISIQLGAILAVCWLFRAKLWHVARNLGHDRDDQRFALNIICAFLPAAVLGALFHHTITSLLFNVKVVALSLLVGGIAILVIERKKPVPRVMELEAITPKRAFLVGLCQAVAMIPGVSRSGATIMGGMLLGIERSVAAEFSFFLAIPTMFGATALELFKSRHELNSESLATIGIGFVVAFISAMLVIKWFMRFISKHGFAPFAWYRIVLGTVILAYLYY